MEASTSKKKMYCCNPLKKEDHNYHKKGLRFISKNLLQKFNMLEIGDKICNSCRKLLMQPAEPECTSDDSVPEEITIQEEKDIFESKITTPEKKKLLML